MVDHDVAQESAVAQDALFRAKDLFAGVFGDGTLTLPELRANLDRMMEEATLDDDVSVDEVVVAGVNTLRVEAGTVATDSVMVWLHGGGYVMGSAHGYRQTAAVLSRALGLAVVVPDYRLAPESPFPAALEDACAVLNACVAQYGGGHVVVGGDSAGGGLAMASLLQMRDRGVVSPAAAVLVSPLADLSGSGASVQSNAGLDPIITARSLRGLAASYLHGHDRRDPRASPVFGDLAGLPPVLLLASDSEALLDDAVRMHESIQNADGESTLSIYPDTCHAWTLFAHFMPQARRGVDEIAQFAGEVLK